MLFLDKFRWHFCPSVAVALLVAGAGSAGWASTPETQKPCSSISQRENSRSAVPPRAESAGTNRAERKGVVAGLCPAQFGPKLASEHKTIWTNPLRPASL